MEEVLETEKVEESENRARDSCLGIANLILLIVSTAMGLLIGEVVFRNSVSYEYLRVRYYRLADIFQSDPAKVMFDPELGFIARPNLDTRFRNQPYDIRVQTNSLGFRDDEESIESSEYLFLGDSFVFGWGIEQEEGLVSQFEKLTGSTSLNMGQSGYGTLQQALLLKRLLPEVRRENQKVLAIIYDNDPIDNCYPVYSPFPTVRKASEEYLITAPVEERFAASQRPCLPTFWKLLSQGSLIADFAINRVFPFEPHMIQDWDPRAAERVARSGEAAGEEEAFKYCLNLLKGTAYSQELDFYACMIPPVHFFQNEGINRLPMIEKVLSELDIRHLDLTPYLTLDDYYSIDGHWKASGHRKAAEAIVDFMVREGALQGPDTGNPRH